jgi:hypothetical protein
MIPFVTASLIASASPSPVPAKSIPCNGRCLDGIGIGDDANVVLTRLGSQALDFSNERIAADFSSYPNGLMLAVYYYKGGVVGVSIDSSEQGKQISVVDPYGIRLGDSASRLTTERGAPTSTSGDVLRYGAADGIHWEYTVKGGIVTTILLSSVPNLP